MLRAIKQDLKDYYYDQTFRDIDLDSHFKQAEERVKQAHSTGQILGVVGQALIDFNDSHTVFIPPTLITSVDYGFRMQTFGGKILITTVRDDSDAFAKGLRVGDEVYSVDGFLPTRANLSELEYSYYVLMPVTRLTVAIRLANGTVRQAEITSKISDNSKVIHRPIQTPLFFEASKETLIVKLPHFELSDGEIDKMMKRCAPYQSLILDLRGNGGGLETALQRLIGYFFDHDVKVADATGRKKTRVIVAKTHKDHVFNGNLTVLVDSDSASAAEMFARVIQLEKRGLVVGDRTSGKVMASVIFGHSLGYRGVLWDGLNPTSFFGVSITVNDAIMNDGRSLENVGVIPDELLFPTSQQLARHEDPVISRAAKLFDIELDPQKAGTLFPARSDTEKTVKEKSGDKN